MREDACGPLPIDRGKQEQKATTRGGKGVAHPPRHNTKRARAVQNRPRWWEYRKPAPDGKHTERALHEWTRRRERERVMAPSKLAKQTRKVAPQNAAAAHRLALWHARGEEGLHQDGVLAFQWERKAAELGCADAQFALGAAYKRGGMDLQAVPATAFAWFRKAALQGMALPIYTSFIFSA